MRARSNHASLLLLLAALALVLLWFVGQVTHYATSYSEASYSSWYWPRRGGLILHLCGGFLAITTGLVQLWLGLTGRTSGLHRALGKFYGTGILLGATGAVYLALTISGAPGYAAGLFCLALAWLVTTGMALYAIRSRRIEQHREWMIRSYVVTFAFVSFRLGEKLIRPMINLPATDDFDWLDTVMAWGCWAVPLLLAEPLIQLRSMRSMRRG
jgi:uncharacterized membrane protein